VKGEVGAASPQNVVFGPTAQASTRETGPFLSRNVHRRLPLVDAIGPFCTGSQAFSMVCPFCSRSNARPLKLDDQGHAATQWTGEVGRFVAPSDGFKPSRNSDEAYLHEPEGSPSIEASGRQSEDRFEHRQNYGASLNYLARSAPRCAEECIGPFRNISLRASYTSHTNTWRRFTR
jgi:hypothetical protein